MTPSNDSRSTIYLGDGRCVLTLPIAEPLPMAARAAITGALHDLTITGDGDPLTAVLAIATDDHVSVFADAPPQILDRWLRDDRLLSATRRAIHAAAAGDVLATSPHTSNAPRTREQPLSQSRKQAS